MKSLKKSKKMSQVEIKEWLAAFKDIESWGLDGHRQFIGAAIDCWFKKDSAGFIYNLRASALSADQIVHFAMRERIFASAGEEYAFWRDLKKYFEKDSAFDFYKHLQ